jgi:hypothetical protein
MPKTGKAYCREETCSSRSQFGTQYKHPEYCGKHRKEGMFNVNVKTCLEPTCRKSRTFGVHGGDAEYCLAHKTADMVNVLDKRCMCGTIACFGPPDGKVIRCGQHRVEGDINISNRNRKCTARGCNKHPSFGTTKPTRCSEHATRAMSDLTHKKCEFDGCSTAATFGIPETLATRCKTHMLPDMVDVRNRCCVVRGCKSRANFGGSDGKRVRCKDHALEDDTLFTRRCDYCNTKAWYGFPGQSPDTCAIHLKAGSIPYPKQPCKADACTSPAVYGNSRALHCESHHLEGERDLVRRECVCGRVELLGESGKCEVCDGPGVRKYVRCGKQRVVRHVLEQAGLEFVYDKPLGCGLQPDFLFPGGVILEVDEYAHTSTGYTPEADMARMRKIQECLGTPHTFIRYNPDEYVTEGVKLDPSPAERHRVLLDTVQSCLATSPSEMQVVYLFYDGYQNS